MFVLVALLFSICGIIFTAVGMNEYQKTNRDSPTLFRIAGSLPKVLTVPVGVLVYFLGPLGIIVHYGIEFFHALIIDVAAVAVLVLGVRFVLECIRGITGVFEDLRKQVQ